MELDSSGQYYDVYIQRFLCGVKPQQPKKMHPWRQAEEDNRGAAVLHEVLPVMHILFVQISTILKCLFPSYFKGPSFQHEAARIYYV